MPGRHGLWRFDVPECRIGRFSSFPFHYPQRTDGPGVVPGIVARHDMVTEDMIEIWGAGY